MVVERKNEAIWVEKRNRWQINVQMDGKRKTFVCSTKGKRGKIAAEKKADKWLVTGLEKESVRTEKLIDEWLHRIEITTSKSYYSQLEKFARLCIKPVIGHKKVGKLNRGDLQRVIDTAFARRNLSRKTLQNLRGALTSFLRYCRDNNASTLYMDKLDIPRRAKRSEKTILYPDAVRTLFSVDTTVMRGKVVQERYIHAYRLSVITGLRPGEVLALEWNDIRDGVLHISRSYSYYKEVTDGKNRNARRSIVLPQIAVTELEQQQKQLRQEEIISKLVFPDVDAGYISQTKYLKHWKRYCETNEITSALTTYELRHTWASINDEMPEGIKKKVMGHSKSMDTEGVYGHLKQGDLQKAANCIDSAMSFILHQDADSGV